MKTKKSVDQLIFTCSVTPSHCISDWKDRRYRCSDERRVSAHIPLFPHLKNQNRKPKNQMAKQSLVAGERGEVGGGRLMITLGPSVDVRSRLLS